MKSKLLIYGIPDDRAVLQSRLASFIGQPHVAAGRDIVAVASHVKTAAQGSVRPEPRIFGLEHPDRLPELLDDIAVVLNCAEPSEETASALIEACIASGTHYADVHLSPDHLKHVGIYGDRARAAGIAVVPGIDFLGVAAAMMAATLAADLPGATELALVIKRDAPLFRREARQIVETVFASGLRFENGAWVQAKTGEKMRQVDFGAGPQQAHLMSWFAAAAAIPGSSGFVTVEPYFVMPKFARRLVSPRGLARLFRQAAWRHRRWLKRANRLPDEIALSKLRDGSLEIWGEAVTSAGQTRVLKLRGPDDRFAAAQMALGFAGRLMDGKIAPGARSAASLGTLQLLEDVPGITLEAAIRTAPPPASDMAAPRVARTAAT